MTIQMQRREKSNEWLDRLGKESWQLELLISGFSIFLLIQGLDLAEQKFHLFFNRVQGIDSLLLSALESYYYFLLIGGKGLLLSLVFHLFLRGLWIAAVGLRTMNKGSNLTSQGFTPLFQRTLRKNTLSLDAYILQLDKFCSNIFAFAYLVLFVALCIGIYIGFVLGSLGILNWFNGDILSLPNSIITKIWEYFIYSLSLIYIMDFAGQGLIKRADGLDKFYFPFYKFLSWISLSFIYRSLYYTMMGNRFSRRFLWFIIPFYILIYFGNSLFFQTQPLIPKSSNPLSLIPGYYDDLNPDLSIKLASTPSRYVSNGVLEVFIPLKMDDELSGKIERYCPDIQPVHNSLIASKFIPLFVNERWIESETQVKPYMECMTKLFKISIDDRVLEPSSFFYQHPKTTQYGLLHMIDIDTFTRGVHIVEIGRIDSKKVGDQDSVYYRPYALLPVWKL